MNQEPAPASAPPETADGRQGGTAGRGRQNHPPRIRPQEFHAALWLAVYAEDVVRQIIEEGRPKADDFIELCAKIAELHDEIPSDTFHERAEDIWERYLLAENT